MIRVFDISIIIPSRADEDSLEGLLSWIRSWHDQPREIIVVDASADWQTHAYHSTYHAQWLTGPESRGTQLRIGASQATSPILWFLHADARPDVRSLPAIAESIAAGSIGGYFQFRLSGARHWLKSAFETLVGLRCRVGTPYGDQAIFVRKDAYRNGGGFDSQPLFEEVRLVRKLRRTGRFLALRIPLEVSSRRWETHGWITVSLRNRLFVIAHALGAPPEWLAQLYWHPRAQKSD